ncbi:MAG: hypothetical protein ACLSHC_15610 [Bilophila wadsworthia]
MAEERLEEAAKDMRNQMTAVAQKVFADAGISQFFDSFDVTTDEGVAEGVHGAFRNECCEAPPMPSKARCPRWSSRRSPPRRSSMHGRRA